MIRFEIMATELCQTTVELGVGNGMVELDKTQIDFGYERIELI